MVFRRVTDKSLLLGTRIGSQGARVLATMILARLVTKEDYGRFELILTIPGLVSAAGDFGVFRSMTASHDLPDDEVQDTGLIALFFLSLVFAALAVAGGWYYARVNADPRLVWVGVIMAATFVVQNIQTAQMAMLARELKFTRWAGVEALMMLATIVTGISVAVAGGGIFALALQQLLAQICGLMATAYAKPLRWPRTASRGIARRFFSFGWKLSLFQWTNNVQGHLSRQAIGQAAGVVAVGVFGRASQVRDLIGYSLVTTFDLVLMPLFARAKDDPERLRDLLVRGTVGVTVFCSFGAAWLVALAPDLIRVVLGPSWSEVPALLQASAPIIAMQGLCYPCIIMALALNAPLVPFRQALLNMIVLGGAVIALWTSGLWYFVATQTVFSIIPTYYATQWGARITGLSLSALLLRALPILAEAAAMCGVMWCTSAVLHNLTDQWMPARANLLRWISNEQLAAIVRLTLSSLAGCLTGWLLLAWIDRRNYRDLIGLLFRRPHTPDAAATVLGSV